MEGQLEGSKSLLDASGSGSAGKEMLKQLARTDPYYKRNRPHVCTFFTKEGGCKRGTECPYRHEVPEKNSLSNQNIRDRYYGRNDPVARKILSGHAAAQGLQPPEDTNITSLFLSSLPETVTEPSLRATLVSSLPNLQPKVFRSIVHVAKSRCAFVNFTDRQSAERAAEAWASGVDIDGSHIAVKWGRSKPATSLNPALAIAGPSTVESVASG